MPNESIILKKIFKKHKPKLKHLNIEHKKLIICFSGIPGTGKTYISKILEKRYKAVRIRSDQIRKIIKKLGNKTPKLLDEDYKEKILRKYLLDLLRKHPFRNNLIILDSGIDREYPKIFLLAKEHGFQLFIIRIKANRRTATKGVIKKLGKLDDNFINSIDRWVLEYKAFGKLVTPNIKIRNKINRPLETKKIFKKLDKIIDISHN